MAFYERLPMLPAANKDHGLKQFIENSPVAVAMFDNNMCYLAVSSKWRSDFDLQETDLLEKSHYEIFPELPQAWKLIHQRALRGETIPLTEDQFVGSNGLAHSLLWRIQPWLHEDQKIGGIVIFSEDITQHKTAEKHARLLSEIRVAFTKADSPKEALQTVCGKILDFLQCDLFLAYLFDERSGQLQLQASHGVRIEDMQRMEWLDVRETFCGRSAAERLPIIVDDVQSRIDPAATNIKLFGLEAYACFPLELGHQVLGTISFGSKRQNTFAPNELELMLAMSDYVSASMQRVVDRAALKDREERLRAVLNSVTDAIINIDQQGKIIALNPATCQVFGYTQEELIGQNVKILMPSPYREEHDQYVRNYLTTGIAKIIGIGRELIAKRKNGEIFPIELTVTEIDHLQNFTGVVRNITERKELQKQLLETVSEEQRRIGQELHDGIGQELTGLTLLAGTIKRLLPDLVHADGIGSTEQHSSAVISAANQLVAGLSETNRHLKDLSHGIMPVQIDAQGLHSALLELAAKLNRQDNRLNCQVDCSEGFAAPNNTAATQLYRIAQEAINNAIRHGEATKLMISIHQDPKQTIMEVQDNGRGFDPQIFLEHRPSSAGMGLKIMQHRMNTIGGWIRAERCVPNGMAIRCVLPRNS